MKKGFYVLFIMLIASIAISCDKTQSYTDMLKAESKAIDRLITDSGFVILKDFPKDTVFGPKEFVKLDDGVYLNIISRGNLSERAVLYKTDIWCRFVARPFLSSSDTFVYNNLVSPMDWNYPVEFKYGNYSTGLNDYYLNIFISSGLASGLPYVGDTSYVRLIVPFKQTGSLGDFQSSGCPIFFDKVRYVFQK